MVKLNELAADIHKRMCEDPGFGYSWAERWGANPTTWDVDGVPIAIKVGDYDCSSSTITAWRLALKAAGYADPLADASYTGNMRSTFLNTGLFKWVPVSQAERGDLYLNETNHVAMCQGGGKLSEFSASETGGIYGTRGDQTGWESHITGYYSYPWDGCLHYIGTKEAGVAPERTVWQWRTNVSDAQKWQPQKQNDGTYKFRNKASGLVLDVRGASSDEGTAVQAFPDNNTKAQRWKLHQASGGYDPKAVAPWELEPVCAPGKRLDVSGASTDDGAKIQIWRSNGTKAQRWAIVDDGEGFWTFVCVATGKAIDVKNGGKA